jgi:thioredoxin-related protein
MNIKSFTLFSLLVASFLFANPFATSANNDNFSIVFLDKASFKDIQDIAYEEDKPIFITFNATWSTPCKIIQSEIFENDKVADYMNENFVNYSANIETKIGFALSEYFDIFHLPTVLIEER